MATEKILNTRIGLKVDTLENWSKSTLPLKKGEVAFATVAATAGNGLTEPVVMMKIGEDGVKTFKDIEWNFYAKASDVLASAKSEDVLRTFINGVIADAGIASSDAMEALAGRVTIAEGDIATLKGDESTAGSIAKAIKDAIDALDLANTYVAIEEGKSLMTDAEHTKLAGVSEGANKVENVGGGKIKIDGTEVTVYEHPATHTVSEISDFDEKVKAYDYATKSEAQGYANAKDDAIAEAKKAGTDAADALNTYKGEMTTALAGKQDVIPENTYDAYGSAAQALADAKAYADQNDADTQYGIEYDSTHKKIKLVSDTSKTEIDASDFIKDGMIDTVTIDEDTQELVITWNTDAGKDATRIKLSELADIYTGVDGTTIKVDVSADDKISAEVKTESIKDGHIASDAAIAKSKLASDVQASLGKADTAVQPSDIGTMAKETATDYVKKSEATGYDDILTKIEAAGAYQAKGDYATAAQGAKADTAVQPETLNEYVKVQDPITIGDDGENDDAKTEITKNNIILSHNYNSNYTLIENTGISISTSDNADNPSYFKVDLGDVDTATGETENVSVQMSDDFKASFNEALGTEAIAKAAADAVEAKLPTTKDYGVLSVAANDTDDKKSGIKVDNTDAQNLKVEIDDTIVWVFDCGGSGVTE